jgi:hypothetical protein
MNVPLRRHQRFILTSGLEPVTFGIPLPKGIVPQPGGWVMADDTGAGAVEATVIDRWADGSIRWLLIDAQLPSSPGGEGPQTLELRRVAADSNQGAELKVSVEPQGDGVLVDTGVLRACMTPGGVFPFSMFEVEGRQAIDTASTGLILTDEAGQTARVTTTRVHIDHQGRLRSTIRLEGDAALGNRRLVVVTRIDFYAGRRILRVRSTIRNPDRARHPGNYWDLGDAGSILIKECAWRLALPRGAVPEARVSPEAGLASSTVGLPFELYQDSSGGENWQSSNHINRNREIPNTFRGYRMTAAGQVTAGERATPIVSVGAGDSAVAVAVPAFWQNFPRAIDVDGSGIAVRFFPGCYADLHELQGGEQKTHECFIAFGADAGIDHLEWCRQPSSMTATPEWVMDSGAVVGLAPLEPGHRVIVDQAIEGPDNFERKREMVDQYGWRHFGDIYGDHEAVGHTGPLPLVSHYNNQYDPVLGFGLQFLRTADPRWFRAMDELAAHVIDIDVYHTDRDKSAYNGGLFWHTYHYGDADTSTHRTYPRRNNGKVFGGGPSADHNYPSGLMLHYFLTGTVASRDAAVGLAQYVLNLDNGRLSPFRFLSTADTGLAYFTPPDYYGPSRSSGNSLNALVDGHRLTRDPQFIEKADRLVRLVVHPHEDPARHRLDEPEYRWFYAMFLQALGKYLVHKAEVGHLDAAYAHGRASLLTYARWMAEHEYPYLDRPEKLEFPTETWAAQDIRKSDIFCHAAMHASGDERALFAERAAHFHRTSIETLERMPTRALARPVIVLLTSGFLQPWYASHPAASLPRPSVEPDFGQPVAFVSQRAIAERRAKRMALAGALTALAAAAAAIVWFG